MPLGSRPQARVRLPSTARKAIYEAAAARISLRTNVFSKLPFALMSLFSTRILRSPSVQTTKKCVFFLHAL